MYLGNHDDAANLLYVRVVRRRDTVEVGTNLPVWLFEKNRKIKM